MSPNIHNEARILDQHFTE